MARSILTTENFTPGARALRRHFEERFADPHRADSGRFVWDYWHIPGQYTALRTPAYHFFPKALYRSFHEKLVLWGRRNLGCHDISPPWLSCYVDGGRQEFHSDLPHGPWAFVYSLTPWKGRKFTGGETFLLRKEMLSYWSNLDRFRGLEEDKILRTIEPRFNRLTVFDPRIPHGVRRVEGVHDPREGRLVIHGWFVQPRPFIEGALSASALQAAIDGLSDELAPVLSGNAAIRGILSVRFPVSASGKTGAVRELSNTLVALDGDPRAGRAVAAATRRFLSSVSFGRQRRASTVTLPLTFEA